MNAQIPHALKPGTKAERFLRIDAARIDEDSRRVTLAFASETPVERSWGNEVLDVSAESMRMGRLKRGGALLMDHDSRDQVGVIESVKIGADKVARAVVRFGKGARASEIFQDVIDGIRQNVSVAYRIHEAEPQEERDGVGTWRVTDWEPFEISIVSIPADPSVGVGRAQPSNFSGHQAMNEATDSLPAAEAGETLTRSQRRALRQPSAEETATRAERDRIEEITAGAEAYRQLCPGVARLAAEAIRGGWTTDQFRVKLLNSIPPGEPIRDIGTIGPGRGRGQTFSIVRALGGLLDRNVDAGFELEVSQEIAHRTGRKPRGIFMPLGALSERVLSMSGAPALLGTEHMGGSFIDALRARSVVMNLGPTILSGLTENVSIPRLTTSATAAWIAGDGADSLTESTPGFDAVTLSPKTVGGLVNLSRRTILQSNPDAELTVRNDLAQVIATELDKAAIQGTGASNQPTGITSTSGISTDTFAAATPTFAEIVAMEGDLLTNNADASRAAYVTTPALAVALKTAAKATNQAVFVWEAGPEPGVGTMNGLRAVATSNCPSGKVILGNFADLIMGLWGAVDLEVNPFADFAKGTVCVRAFASVDIAVRHAKSFAVYSTP